VTTDRLTRTVREQVALGRLLPLGGPDDAVWITEEAAVGVLRHSCAALPGVRLGEVEVDLVPAEGPTAAVPGAAPMGALPHGPVRIGAGFEAGADEPLPVAADRLRSALWESARNALGLDVWAVDLRVTGLLEDDGAAGPADAGDSGRGGDAAEPEAGPGIGPPGVAETVEAAARAVPGVLRLTRRLAGFGTGLRVRDHTSEEGGPQAPGRQVQVQIAVAPDRVPLEVARAVVAAVSAAAVPGAPGPVTAAVVVTDTAEDTAEDTG
jgi:hypothetical protein